ncbi:MAG: hypothetical protein FWD50_06545 [Betaproteobacteria bacterium]|nr:hypothetical protein [Betaproteobacteria bacterium]
MRFLYLVYGLIVLLSAILYNYSGTGSSSWSSSGGSRSGWSSSGSHK